MATSRIKRIEYAPTFGDQQKDAWLERLVQNLNEFSVPDPNEVVTADVLKLSRGYALSSGGTYNLSPAPNADDDMLGWLVDYGGTLRAVFAARGTDNRWRHVGSLPLDNSTAPQTLATVTASGTQGTTLLYVPHGGNSGSGHGKWWLFSSSNHTIRVIEPSDLSYTDYTLGSASNNITPYAGARYSADLDRVFWLNGGTVSGGTRLCTVNPAAVTIDKEDTGWTDVRGWDLETAGGVTSKVWMCEYTTGTNALWTLDATDITVAPVDTNVNVAWAPWPVIYAPDVDSLFLVQFGSTGIQIVNATSYATSNVSTGLSANASAVKAAYIGELHSVAFGTASDFNVIDTRFMATPAGTTVPMAARIYGGSDWVSNKHELTWSADFRELYVANGSRDELWILST